jgi:Tfp pilus assembly protein PilF
MIRKSVADAEFAELYVEELIATGHLVEADREARSVLGRYPARLGPRWQLAEVAIRRGQPGEALRLLDGPEGGHRGQDSGLVAAPRPWLLRGWAMVRMGHPEGARAALTQARQLAPDHPQVRLLEARLALASGDRPRARALLMPLAARFVHDAQVTLVQAQLALADGQLELARTGFERALGQDASDPQTWTTLGTIRWQLGRLAESATAFEVALRLQAGLPEAVLGLARVLHDQGDLGRAQREAEHALKVARPDPREALVLLAHIRQENREPLVVVDLSRRAHAVTLPLGGEARRRLEVELAQLEAEAALGRDDATGAQGTLERALQAHPRQAPLEALLLEAKLRRAKGRQRRALLAELAKPATVPMRQLAARLAVADGRASEAVLLLQQVLEAQVKERAAPRLLAATQAELASALLAAGQTEPAATVIKGGLLANPRSAQVHLVNALVQEARGRIDLADGELSQAAALQPRLPQVQFYLAQRHLRQRNMPAARAALRAYIELDPAGILVVAAREQLKRLSERKTP